MQGPQIIEEFLNDNPYSPFPLLRSTERVDEAARQLLGGKVVILTDNSPFALSAPTVLVDFYQTMDDYYFGYWAASLLRLIRLPFWARRVRPAHLRPHDSQRQDPYEHPLEFPNLARAQRGDAEGDGP